MKKHLKLRLVVLIISILLLTILVIQYGVQSGERMHFSQSPLTPLLPSPIKTSEEFRLISVTNINSMREVGLLLQNENSPVVAISEGMEPDVVQVVYQNGFFRQWDLKSKAIVKNQIVFLEDPAANDLPIYQLNTSINFSADGIHLITPSELNPTQFPPKYSIWNLASMEKSIFFSYDQHHALYPSKDIEFSAGDTSISMEYNLFDETDGGGGVFLIRDSQEPSFTRIAIDPVGDYLAVADDEGNLLLGDISSIKTLPRDEMFEGFYAFSSKKKATYQLFGYSGKNVPTVDLEFDETHSWIGWLTDQKLILWSLKNYFVPLHMNMDLKNANAMRFDHTGQILAVATKNGITIFDLVEKKQIIEYQTGEVTALYFSRDNHLLIWGDAQGTIHLWGVIG